MSDLISRQAAIDIVKFECGEWSGLARTIVKAIKQLPSVQSEPSTEIQEILEYLDTTLHPIVSPDNWNVYAELHDMVSKLPSAQPDVSDTNVGDMISRQEAIDAFDCCELTPDGGIDANDARDILEQLPSAQPEIIRCKDCKWWSNDDYRECSSPNYNDGHVTPAGFYCGYAERRTDERTD